MNEINYHRVKVLFGLFAISAWIYVLYTTFFSNTITTPRFVGSLLVMGVSLVVFGVMENRAKSAVLTGGESK